MKMVALKTFSFGGATLTFQGEEFDVSKERSEEYIRLELAKPVGDGEIINPPTDSPVRDIPQSDYTEEELKAMNMKELNKIAKNIGVTNYSTMSKAEIIFAIRGTQNMNRGGTTNV